MRNNIMVFTLNIILVITFLSACGNQTIDSSVPIDTNSSIQQGSDSIVEDGVSEELIVKLFDMKKVEIIELLGDYDEGTMAIEESHMVFPVLSFGNGLVIYGLHDDESNPSQIECSENIVIRNVKSGMNFSEVQERLGGADVIETWIANEEVKAYKLEYKFLSFILEFISYDDSGEGSSMIIRR